VLFLLFFFFFSELRQKLLAGCDGAVFVFRFSFYNVDFSSFFFLVFVAHDAEVPSNTHTKKQTPFFSFVLRVFVRKALQLLVLKNVSFFLFSHFPSFMPCCLRAA
jgi:hypothetical protein